MRRTKDLTKVGKRVRTQRRNPNSPLWRRKCLSLWAKIVRRKNVCAVCHDPAHKGLQAHHILPKERYRWRMFELSNGVCLCYTCHKMSRFSAHRNPLWFTEWLRQNKPAKFKWAMDRLLEAPKVQTMTFVQIYERLKILAVKYGVSVD